MLENPGYSISKPNRAIPGFSGPYRAIIEFGSFIHEPEPQLDKRVFPFVRPFFPPFSVLFRLTKNESEWAKETADFKGLICNRRNSVIANIENKENNFKGPTNGFHYRWISVTGRSAIAGLLCLGKLPTFTMSLFPIRAFVQK